MDFFSPMRVADKQTQRISEHFSLWHRLPNVGIGHRRLTFIHFLLWSFGPSSTIFYQCNGSFICHFLQHGVTGLRIANRKQLQCQIAMIAVATFFASSQQSVLPVGKTSLCGTTHIAILSHEHQHRHSMPLASRVPETAYFKLTGLSTRDFHVTSRLGKGQDAHSTGYPQ